MPPGLFPEFLRQWPGFRQQLGRVLRDETGIQSTGGKGRVLQQPQQEAAVAVNATDQGAAQQVQQMLPGLFPVVAPGDQLAQQRVVPGADLVALAYAAVDALARPGSGSRYSCSWPLAGRKSWSGSSAYSRTSIAWPCRGICCWVSGSGSPRAMRSCHSTRSSPVMASVTGCSTCNRVFISMK